MHLVFSKEVYLDISFRDLLRVVFGKEPETWGLFVDGEVIDGHLELQPMFPLQKDLKLIKFPRKE